MKMMLVMAMTTLIVAMVSGCGSDANAESAEQTDTGTENTNQSFSPVDITADLPDEQTDAGTENTDQSSSPVDIPKPDVATVIHTGHYIEYGIFSTKGSKLLSSQTAYEDELLKYTSESPLIIDFKNNKVLMVDMGMRNTGGYSIAVDEVVTFDDHVVVHINLTIPGGTCVVTQGLTNPYQFIQIATNQSDLLIREYLMVDDCE